MTRQRVLGLLLALAAAACYVGIVTIRQGPPSGGDTVPLTAVTAALANGQLRAAAGNTSLPNPPGYALLTAPFVAAFPSLVGASTWCTTPGRAAGLRGEAGYAHDPTFGQDVDECGSPARLPDGTLGPPLPFWYDAQGVLGVVAWLVLALGGLLVLRAAGAASLGRVGALLAFLAFLPAAASAIVQLFHPQDLLSLGLSLCAVALALRQRWAAAGALFGLAVLTKQFALLLLLPAFVFAPDPAARIRLGVVSVAVLAAGILPFLVVAPHATLDNFSGFSAGGAVSGATVLSLAGVTGKATSAVARDAPLVFSAVVCLWAAGRRGSWRTRPEALLALALACTGSRLVFESVVFPYYLLASTVLFFLMDLVARRNPYKSLAWSAGAAFFVAVRPANNAVDAVGTLAFAALAVLAGLAEMARVSEPRRFSHGHVTDVAPPDGKRRSGDVVA